MAVEIRISYYLFALYKPFLLYLLVSSFHLIVCAICVYSFGPFYYFCVCFACVNLWLDFSLYMACLFFLQEKIHMPSQTLKDFIIWLLWYDVCLSVTYTNIKVTCNLQSTVQIHIFIIDISLHLSYLVTLILLQLLGWPLLLKACLLYLYLYFI